METSKAVQEAYASVREFNDIAGNLTNVTDEGVDNQISLIFEELTETIDGFEAGDKVAVLDGAIDLFVVVSGLMQKLEAQGYGVAEALKRVTDNNMTKFPPLGALFGYDPAFKLRYNEQYKRTAIIDGNGKIRKPLGYVSVELNDLVPA